MKRSLVYALIVYMGTLLVGFSAQAGNFQIGSDEIKFEPGEGFCALNEEKSDFDRVMIDWQRKANADKNALIAIFANCARLAALRTGEGKKFGEYGILLSPYVKGQVQKLRGYSRKVFLKAMANAIGGGINFDEGSLNARLNDSLDPLLKREVGKIELTDTRLLGLLDKDDIALYTGIIMNVKMGKEKTVNAGVMAMTLVNEYMVQYSLYSEFIDKRTIVMLLDRQKRISRTFVELNETLSNHIKELPKKQSSSGSEYQFTSGFNWGRIVEKGIAGAVIGGIFAAVVGLFGLFRRRKKSIDK